MGGFMIPGYSFHPQDHLPTLSGRLEVRFAHCMGWTFSGGGGGGEGTRVNKVSF